MKKWIESYQMWWSLFGALGMSIEVGISHQSFELWLLSFWILFPLLMILAFLYNWAVK